MSACRGRRVWSEVDRKHAFDLLGVPARSRKKSTLVPEGNDFPGLAQLVSREIVRLRQLVDTVLAAEDQNDYAERDSRACHPTTTGSFDCKRGSAVEQVAS